MRRMCFLLGLLVWLAMTLAGQAATGQVVKVLPHLLDSKERIALGPSLYERDAYQFLLRQHPEQRSGLRFDVKYKTKGPAWEPLTVRLELRGLARSNLPRQMLIEKRAEPARRWSHWTSLTLSGDDYRDFGEMTAWRVTLWEGSQLLAEQKSFLW